MSGAQRMSTGQAVARSHRRMQDVGGFLLLGVAVRGHRQTAIGHENHGARAKRQSHAQTTQSQKQRHDRDASQAGHQTRGERP